MTLDFTGITVTLTLKYVRADFTNNLRIKVDCNDAQVLDKIWQYLKKSHLAKLLEKQLFFDDDSYGYHNFTIAAKNQFQMNGEVFREFANVLVKSEWLYLEPETDDPNTLHLKANRCLYAWLELPWLQRRITNPSKVKPRKLLS